MRDMSGTLSVVGLGVAVAVLAYNFVRQVAQDAAREKVLDLQLNEQYPPPRTMSTATEHELANLQQRIDYLETLVYIPGMFHCPKCQLLTSTASYSAGCGFIPGTGETTLQCPRCTTNMWKVTWKDHAENLLTSLSEARKIRKEQS